MRISHAHKLIYFSIPKTASEAVRAYLDPMSDETVVTYPEVTPHRPFYSHVRPVEVRSLLRDRGHVFEAYSRIATVRNPFARLASLYRMARRGGAVFPDGQRLPFDAWLARLDPTGASVSHISEKWYAHGIMSMSEFLSDADGQMLVDHTFRVEDQLGHLQDLVNAQTGLDGTIMHSNRAPRPYDWREMYSSESRAIVETLYADDLRRWSYSFDGN